MVKWSILNGGCGLRCLSHDGYNLQKGLPVDVVAAIEDVADIDMKDILKQALACNTEEAFTSLINKSGDQIAQYGYPKVYTCKLADKEQMVLQLLKQQFVYGVHAEIAQFTKGLNRIGNLGQVVFESQELFNIVLGNQHPRLTKASFMSMYELHRSEKGSNKREREDSTIYCFELFLQDLEEGEISGLALEDVLAFITAADAVLPLGFDKKITIEFYDFEGTSRRRPHASTCGLYFFLPRGFNDPSEFSEFFKESLLDCQGFGKL